MANTQGRTRYGQHGDCYLFGHSWDYTNSTWRSSLGGVPVTLRCERCNTERRETWSRSTGERMTKPRYVYPPGYSRARSVTGVEKPTRDDLRAWALADQSVAARRRARREPAERTLRAVT